MTANSSANVGLSTAQARERIAQYGVNAVPEERPRPFLLLLRKFWSPVPWMLEVTLVIELALGKVTQGMIIAGLLVLNALLSFLQEGRASSALALLRQRLAIQVRVLRDGQWQLILAENLVPGDVVRVRVGDFVPADLRLYEGQVLVDQSSLTGESMPKEVEPGQQAFAGSIVRRGEATGEVTATGLHTFFGKTASLIKTAAAPSHLETLIFTIVRYLVVIDLFLVAAILVYALVGGIPLFEIVPFALILLVASVPVALPATSTLASALGSLELAKRGVLVTRLSAVEEAAAMDVLCCDKTGTITSNLLCVSDLQAIPPHSQEDLLRLAALACEESTQDPIDLAILSAARQRDLIAPSTERIQFHPFDPSTKRSEAVVVQDGNTLHVIKGAPAIVEALTIGKHIPGEDVDQLASQGCRVLAVASGSAGELHLVGLIALKDPPREDSQTVLQGLAALGVRVVMVTGDGPATAQAIASQVGINGGICPPDGLRAADISAHLTCSVFAGVFPEDKYRLVEAFQQAGYIVGMTGDGVNDAPALKQAEVGIAVANAADVAKAAAALVLTQPGLSDVVAAVETGRRIHRRMLTYLLNKMIKTFQIALLLSLGLLITGVFVTTPRMVLLLLFVNDFVTMSLSADRVTFSRTPDRWRIPQLMSGAAVIASAWLLLTFAVFFVGRDTFGFDLAHLQTLVFLALVFTGQATVYLVRERNHFWSSQPGHWLLLTSAGAVLVASLLAGLGILMAPISPSLVIGLFLLVLSCAVLLDFVKVWVFQRVDLR
ncbi:MAG: plasma-membrane proton-efflux P-type ATPase [Planctomycetes bacterium]|nr:plasma-membrane proton-efflux P-type ATPase [Planctomycetota bacterium]